jgi:hypothetical protein
MRQLSHAQLQIIQLQIIQAQVILERCKKNQYNLISQNLRITNRK